MVLYLNNDEINIITDSIKNRPWDEVNALMIKLNPTKETKVEVAEPAKKRGRPAKRARKTQ